LLAGKNWAIIPSTRSYLINFQLSTDFTGSTVLHKLQVKIPAVEAQSYTISIGSGTLAALWDKLESEFAGLRKFVVTDSNLQAAGHLETLTHGKDVSTYVIDPSGEKSKNIDTVVAIIEKMEKEFFGRDSVIVALGGGTVGDIAGFCAAIYKRGVKVVQIPTTTVAQADSSVGGKTGVDSTVSKNAFGAFWQPAAVYIDVETLLTLDDMQYRAGLVESVKHALIADKEYFDFLVNNMPAILARDDKVLQEIAYKNCSIKAEVVAEDPTEQNMRRILNYGHTIGHAVESASGFALLHGQAVAIGIAGAGIIENKLGIGGGHGERIGNLLAELGMDLKIPAGIDKKQLIDLLKRDKKSVNKWPKFVLLEDLGKALCRDGQWAHNVGKDLVEETLDELY
jgi:3-dehydroquinate synthase